MRKCNAILTVLILLLFLYHLLYGAMELAGMVRGGSAVFGALSDVLIALIFAHIVIGIILTAQTLKAERQAGVSYVKQNRLFWVRRISGFALFLFMLAHVLIFTGTTTGGVYRLKEFTAFRLATQILLVLSLLLHLCTNITPLKIALGITDKRSVKTDVILVLAVLLLLAGLAFVLYFVRWQTL